MACRKDYGLIGDWNKVPHLLQIGRQPEGDPSADDADREQRRCQSDAKLVRDSRGTVVDLDALAAALRDGHLRGAAIDVFPAEPSSNAEIFATPLQGLDNVILTPHIGGSTREAQERIGAEVARKLIEYSDVGSTVGAVNFPQAQLPPRATGTRFIQVQHILPGMLGRLDDVFARRKINIAAQYYQTDGEIGYVVRKQKAWEATELRSSRRSDRSKERSARACSTRSADRRAHDPDNSRGRSPAVDQAPIQRCSFGRPTAGTNPSADRGHSSARPGPADHDRRHACP